MLSVRTIRKLNGIKTCTQKRVHRVSNLFSIALNCNDLWIQAYSNIHANKGSMTKGVSGTTIDGFSQKRVDKIVTQLREGKYYPQPSKRVFIPKQNGKRRPLGIPSAEDKLVQEVWKILLEAIYEAVFVPQSHGFRPKKSCHTALQEVKRTWRGVKWFAEFDIKGFFDNIEHEILIRFLEKRIEDRKFIKVIKMMLKAGYTEEWKFHKTYSGTPQGGIISPILANIYLHELDLFINTIPFNKGIKRSRTKLYRHLEGKRSRLKRKINTFKDEGKAVDELFRTYKVLTHQQHQIPSLEARDPNFKRLRYIRYADDFLIGIIGSKQEAQLIQQKVIRFIEQELNLEISKEKTNIKHSKEGIIFLGYRIHSFSKGNVRKQRKNGVYCKMRNSTDVIALSVPKEKMEQFCLKKGYGNLNEPKIGRKIKHRPQILQLSDAEIVQTYNAELRGISNYYSLAYGAKQALSHLVYVGVYSMYKTLANKHKMTMVKMIKKLDKSRYSSVKVTINGKNREYKVFRLKDWKPKMATCQKVDLKPNILIYGNSTEIVRRFFAKTCEYCGVANQPIEVHHIKKLRDIRKGKEYWKLLMISRQRKTLVLCRSCHRKLHNGTLPDLRHVKKN